jgi:hypothetical protein
MMACRLYFEYVAWLERVKIQHTLAWTVSAEKDYGHLVAKTPVKDKAARETQRKAAEEKLKSLIAAYGCASGAPPRGAPGGRAPPGPRAVVKG